MTINPYARSAARWRRTKEEEWNRIQDLVITVGLALAVGLILAIIFFQAIITIESNGESARYADQSQRRIAELQRQYDQNAIPGIPGRN